MQQLEQLQLELHEGQPVARVLCPENTAPGTTIQVQVNGFTLSTTVPEGTLPGQEFRILLPSQVLPAAAEPRQPAAPEPAAAAAPLPLWSADEPPPTLNASEFQIPITPLPTPPARGAPSPPAALLDDALRCTYTRAASDGAGPLEGYLQANPTSGAASLHSSEGLLLWSAFLDLRQGTATLAEFGGSSVAECVQFRLGEFTVLCSAADADAAARGDRSGQHRAKRRRTATALEKVIAESAAQRRAAREDAARRRAERQAMLSAWDALDGMTCKAKGGERRRRADIFLSLPSRQELPDYYELISEPIDLNRIRAKAEAGLYADGWDGFAADIRLMFANALKYNDPESEVGKDAEVMRKAFDKREGRVRAEIAAELERAQDDAQAQIKTEPEDGGEGKGEREGEAARAEIKEEAVKAEPAQEPQHGAAAAAAAAEPAGSAEGLGHDSSQAEPGGDGPAAAAAAAGTDGGAAAEAQKPPPWSVHGLVPVLLEIIEPPSVAARGGASGGAAPRRFRERLTWDLNPSNRYTPIECATSICADRGLPSLMAPAIAVAIEGQLRECIFHKPRERDGECVVAMRLRIEVDSCTPATGAFCLFALFLIALLTVYAYGVADHFTDQLEW